VEKLPSKNYQELFCIILITFIIITTSTLFGVEAMQTDVLALAFNTLWIGSGADQRLRVGVATIAK